MYTQKELLQQLNAMKINPKGTLLVHSSMKAIGQVEGGADAVLDVLCEYMKNGLLVFPTHTWSQMNETYNIFDVKKEPSCVGLLSNLFLKKRKYCAFLSSHPLGSRHWKGCRLLYRRGRKLTNPLPPKGLLGKAL